MDEIVKPEIEKAAGTIQGFMIQGEEESLVVVKTCREDAAPPIVASDEVAVVYSGKKEHELEEGSESVPTSVGKR